MWDDMMDEMENEDVELNDDDFDYLGSNEGDEWHCPVCATVGEPVEYIETLDITIMECYTCNHEWEFEGNAGL